ncbi:MAG: GDSL-type esterase/lipase family protein [Cyanobacteria bacterium P01_G01_bin.19]
MGIYLISLNDPYINLAVSLDNIADYSQSSNGIIANLATDRLLMPIFDITEQPAILPLGDSITAGVYPTEPTPGAYRLQLENNFIADDLSIDFVGSRANEGTELNDPEHEGRPGWTINELTNRVANGLLIEYQPDILLLMAGTNDILQGDNASTVIEDLNQLIDLIQDEQSEVSILVSSLAPIDPAARGEDRANTVDEVNAMLPELASEQGELVTYVNGGGALDLDDLVADGIHPDAAGYDEIGDAWYDALVEQDTFAETEHIIGTTSSDRLTGNDGANILLGNGGADTLTGGEGRDSFVYESFDTEIDTITDFGLGDRLIISAADFDLDLLPNNNLTGIDGETGVYFNVTRNSYTIGTTPYFFYETETGILSFDSDGTGETEAVAIAILSNSPPLSSKQVEIVA